MAAMQRMVAKSQESQNISRWTKRGSKKSESCLYSFHMWFLDLLFLNSVVLFACFAVFRAVFLFVPARKPPCLLVVGTIAGGWQLDYLFLFRLMAIE